MYLRDYKQSDTILVYKHRLDTYFMEKLARQPVISDDVPAPIHQDLGQFESCIQTIAQNKDKDAFIQLFEYFAPRIKSFLIKGGMSLDQADELSQDTMLTIWNKAHLYDPSQASASTWIFTIARNKKIDVFRKQGRPEPDPNDPMLIRDDLPQPGDALYQKQKMDAVKKAMKTLPREQADLIHKSYFEDKTHDAIARETRLPLGTVKSRIRLALERLRKDKDIQTIEPEQ